MFVGVRRYLVCSEVNSVVGNLRLDMGVDFVEGCLNKLHNLEERSFSG